MFMSLVKVRDAMGDLFFKSGSHRAEVDKLEMYFGGSVNNTGLAMGHREMMTSRKTPKILVCGCVDGNAVYLLKWA